MTKRYQRGNHNLYIEEELTTQWPKDTKGSIYRFWLPLWYLLAIVSSALLRYTDSDYPFGIFWPSCCQKIPKRLSESVYRRRTDNTMAKRYQRVNQNMYIEEELTTQWPFGIVWPLCCQFLFDIGIRITPLVSFGHCVVSSSSIYDSDYPEHVYRRRTDNTMAKRYQRGNPNPYIEEELTTQWPTDTKGVIGICISKKNW
jgi:hypothetical protein